MKNLDRLCEQAAQVAEMAGNLLLSHQIERHEITRKGCVDLVTEMDLASERLIRSELHKRCPEISFFGEEDGGDSWQQGLVWVVDPLDGTTNYAHNLDHYCVSIALCQDGEPIAAALSHPSRSQVYHAYRGGGAWCNRKPIVVSGETDMNSALAVTGFPYNRRECMPEILQRLELMLMQVQGVRRLGSAALDLCYVARGIFSIFWENNLKPWDVAAGALLVTEAGGQISCFNGRKMQLDSGELLATNKILHQATVELLGQTSKFN